MDRSVKGQPNNKHTTRKIESEADSADDKYHEKKNLPNKRFFGLNAFDINANIILLLAVILYLITLIGCKETQAECLKRFDQTKLKYFAIILITSGFLFTLIYNLAIYRKIHYSIPIYTTAIIGFLCYIYDTGSDLKSHGAFNRVFLFVIMIISFFLQHLITFLFIFIRKVGYIKGLITFALIIIGLTVYLHYKLIASCEMWSKGLKGTEIDNSGPGCRIKKPKYCWMNFMDNVFDISGWMGEDCNQIRMDDRINVLRWTRVRNAKRIAYPRTEFWKYFPESTLNQFQFIVLGNIIDLDHPKIPQVLKDNSEIFVDFTKPNPEMSVKVKRNEKLVLERRKVRRNSLKSHNFIAKNVIHLFIDSLSRDNFRRKLKKTYEMFENLYQNKETSSRVYQFLKYHAIASWTFANMIPIEFGVDTSFKGSPDHMNKFYKEKGFIIGQAQNYCQREFYDIEEGNIEKYNFVPFDHEGNAFSCDPNFTVPGHPFAMLNGPYGMKRRCLYGRDTSYYAFEYAKEFWKAYKDEPKFFRLALNDPHEGTGEVAKYLDDKVVDFLNFLEAQGSLKDTVILLQSDHGVNMPGFYTFVDAEDFWIEKTLPSLFMMVPQDVAEKYDEVIKSKENILLHPYDLHNTFLNLANAPKSAYNLIGASLFVKTDDEKERTCDKFNVLDPYCICMGQRGNPSE
jgi:hypothetical protein